MLVDLGNISRVKEFVAIAQSCAGDTILKSDRYVINGKSILGIFSLDLSKRLELIIHTEEKDDEIIEALNPFIV